MSGATVRTATGYSYVYAGPDGRVVRCHYGDPVPATDATDAQLRALVLDETLSDDQRRAAKRELFARAPRLEAPE